MIVCGCGTKFECEKNGVGVDFGGGHVYRSDSLRCPKCDIVIYVTAKAPMIDRDYDKCEEYFRMKAAEAVEA